MSASASKSALILSPCLRWAGPEAKAYEDEYADTTKRDKGIAFHEGMDGYYTAADSKVRDLEVQHWVDLAVDWSKEHLEPRCKSILSEVYVSFNFETGEAHSDSSVRDRAYPEMPGYLPGTADLVCILSGGELLVCDWKTGGGTGADKQLLSLALGLRKVFPLPDGTGRKVHLAVLYAGEDGVLPHEWEVSESDLLAHQHAMAFQLADVGIRNDPVVGIHCTQLYCPHLAYCPGVGAIVVDQSESPEGLLPAERLVRRMEMTDKPISDEEAGYTMERISAAKRRMKYLEEAIRRYVMSGGRAIAGDFEFGPGKDGFRWRKKQG